MKTEILQILEMQAQGKLTRDQAAELLAALADQAREKDDAHTHTHASSEGAPGPRGEKSTPPHRKSPVAGASAAIHDMIDAAIGMGTTVGRAASVWGGEFLSMVHRDEGGNSVTLSRVTRPSGDAYLFRGNAFNVSKVLHLELQQAEVCNNTLSGGNLVNLKITRGRFSQCAITGSSVSDVTIEGPAGDAIVLPASESGQPGGTGIRAATFNATKFAHAAITGLSRIEAGTFQAAFVRDLQLADSTIKDVRVNDTNLFLTTLERSQILSSSFDRVTSQELKIRDTHLDRVTFHSVRMRGLTVAGGNWTNVAFRATNAAHVVQETTFDNCTLTNVLFEGCTFRRTALRNLKLTDITIRNIDFTGMTLETEEAFRRAAGM